MCVRKRLRHDHVLGHLCGEITLGTYLLDEESRGRYLVLDADTRPDWRRLQAVGRAVEELGATAYLERSRRGGHLWLFFSDLLEGATIRRFGQGLMLFFGLGGLELFPKQGQLSGGPGSLIRVPFGVHRKSGRRYGFYTLDGRPLAPALREQLYLWKIWSTCPSPCWNAFLPMHPPLSAMPGAGAKGRELRWVRTEANCRYMNR